jgi:hypothetical protein
MPVLVSQAPPNRAVHGKRDGWRWRGSPLYPFTTLVGEQLTRLGARGDAQIQVDYINEFRTRSAEAIESADLGAIFSSQDPANLRVFDAYLDAASKSIADAMTPEWG